MEPIEITPSIISELIDSDVNKMYTNEGSGLQHTHWRVHYVDGHKLFYEAICKNQFGGTHGIGIYGEISLTQYKQPNWFYNWTDVLA